MNQQPMQLSFVIPAFNEAACIEACLESIAAAVAATVVFEPINQIARARKAGAAATAPAAQGPAG